jgi:hypothetical protein
MRLTVTLWALVGLFATASAQNVAIGTALPAQKLQVVGGNVQIDLGRMLGADPADVFAYNGFSMGRNAIGWYNDPQWSAFGNSSWLSGMGSLKFFTNGTARATIDYNGRLGIGTMTPATSLEVFGAVTTRLSTTMLTTDDQVVVVDNSSYRQVISSIGDPASRDFRLTQGLAPGQMLTLEGAGTGRSRLTDNSACRNPENTADAGNLHLDGDYVFTTNSTLQLMFNVTDWVEVNRTTQPYVPPSQSFTFTGADQVFNVPAGVTQITAKLWGGAGGGGGGDGYFGGGGGDGQAGAGGSGYLNTGHAGYVNGTNVTGNV